MDTAAPSIVWLEEDLRLRDNAALAAAVRRGGPVVVVFIWAPTDRKQWQPGSASRWWLHQSLGALDRELRSKGQKLILRQGAIEVELPRLIQDTKAKTVYWNRRYEPMLFKRDEGVERALRKQGIEVRTFPGRFLYEPGSIRNKSGKPFQVFSPFWKTCLSSLPEVPEASNLKRLPPPAVWPKSLSLDALKLEPKFDWAGGMRCAWKPGEAGAWEQLDHFLNEAFEFYGVDRNRPDLCGTSRLSPHLHFGEISPFQIWRKLRERMERRDEGSEQWRNSQFIAELGWREFAGQLLFEFPETTDQPLKAEFKSFPWRQNREWLELWQRGSTGYPMVDAGMRELWTTGWMHNRVRMITASFLVKHLLIPWHTGAKWFWDTLVDADLANNTLGWQWTAGCGADAAPYFRIFNPVTQGEKFDPQGDYVRRWVPELANLPAKWIHQPFAAPREALDRAGVRLGQSYPNPVVSHTIAREVALEAYGRFRLSLTPPHPNPLPKEREY